jgi:hypothetical protein
VSGGISSDAPERLLRSQEIGLGVVQPFEDLLESRLPGMVAPSLSVEDGLSGDASPRPHFRLGEALGNAKCRKGLSQDLRVSVPAKLLGREAESGQHLGQGDLFEEIRDGEDSAVASPRAARALATIQGGGGRDRRDRLRQRSESSIVREALRRFLEVED